ncbi:MAG: branched-chain amino acid ABC transporter permease [Rhodospirillales bacterium]
MTARFIPAGDARARKTVLFALMAALLILTGLFQSWNLALAIFNLCVISAVMAMGVNMQWGYAGLFNAGGLGFAALGGLAVIIISAEPVDAAWAAGGGGVLLAALIAAAAAAVCVIAWRRLKPWPRRRGAAVTAVIVIGYFAAAAVYDPAVEAIEAVNPVVTGYLGGMGLHVLLAWPAGGLFAGAAAWVIGKTALGLRSDYLAIATLGISEIVISVLKNEEWLTRGVKNVTGLPRPVPYEIDLQQAGWFSEITAALGLSAAGFSSVIVKLCYSSLFLAVLLGLLFLAERMLHSPWGRMMRAVRDNETAAEAMGKDVTWRHLQVFVLGSAVIGVAGAMLVTLDGQFTPTSYQPLRFTFLIWVMVIVGGSGNNFGAVLGGFVIWFVWIQSEPAGLWLIELLTGGLAEDNAVRMHLTAAAPHMRVIVMGLALLLTLRFAPGGLLPEQSGGAGR